MKQARIWGYLPAFCLAALPLTVQGQSQNELKLGMDVAKVTTGVADIPLTLSTTDQVQGLVAAFDWAASAGTGVSLTPGPAIADADTVVQRVEPSYMVLGVVMDSDGTGNEVISPGNDQLVATAGIRCSSTLGINGVEFRDGMYATVDGGPILDNIVVVGGLSIGATEGLVLTNGSFDCVAGFNRFYIGPNAGNAEGQRCGNAQVLMENLAPVEGLVVALCHDTTALTLDSISLGAAIDTTAEADFTQSEVLPNGGTLGVVTDLMAPFTNATIPAGEANHIATFRYCCNTLPPAGQTSTSPLTFCDMTLGNPLKENVIVVGGLSIGAAQGLQLENGSFLCRGGTPVIPQEDCDNGIDDDEDDLVDLDDPDCQKAFACGTRQQDPNGNPIGPAEGSLGGPAEVCFYIKTPEDNAVGHPQPDHVQGFSMGLTFCCDKLQGIPVLDIRGTIIEALGAEFVSIQVDNGMGEGPTLDGDPECEVVIGVLLDTLPPFDGQTIPPSDVYQRVGCMTFIVTENPAQCGQCCTIEFTDGVKGLGVVPIKNLLSSENKSTAPQLNDCQVCIKDKERFHRGDCNFMPGMSMGNMSVDISDAAAVVSALFGIGDWKFVPMCPDACDCNDDGLIDLADAICILQFLFRGGNFPPAPGPGFSATNPDLPPGEDPTADKLDCPGGASCPTG
jgi:hypothetical protein